MILKYETILSFYTHKNQEIFCQIKVLPSESCKFKNTCRSLTQEQWNIFDNELEKLLDSFNSAENGKNEELGKFSVKPNISVKVQKSKLSLKYLIKCLPSSSEFGKDECGKFDDIKDIPFALECLLDLQQDLETLSPDGTLLTYEPYTPSKKKYHFTDDIAPVKTTRINLLNYNEDTYAPKPLFQTTTTELLTEIISEYKPAPIEKKCNSTVCVQSSDVDFMNKNILDTEDKSVFPQKTKEDLKYIPEAQKINVIDIPGYVPTPIDWSPIRKALKTYGKYNIDRANKKLRKRSKTVDTISKDLATSIFCKQNSQLFSTKSVEPKVEKIPKYESAPIGETSSLGESDKSLDKDHVNGVIINTENETVFPQNYRSLRLKSKKKAQKECETKQKNQETNVVCTPTDSIPKELDTCNGNFEINKKSEDNKEKKNKSYKVIYPTKGKERTLRTKFVKIVHTHSLSEDESHPTHSKKLKKRTEIHSRDSDNDFEDTKKVDKEKNLQETSNNVSNLNTCTPSVPKLTTISPPKVVRKRKQSEQLSSDIASLRRSKRSPSKPNRFIEEIYDNTTKNKNKNKQIKTSKNQNKELLGTDDDDDDYFENNSNTNEIKTKTVFETPISEKPYKSSSSFSSSNKKKRKRDRSSECEQEKRDISKWLFKRKTSSLNLDPTASKGSEKSQRFKSPSLKSSRKAKSSVDSPDDKEILPESITSSSLNFDIPTKEELEVMRSKAKLMQKENEKVRAELDKMYASPPMEVQNLSLQDMPLNDILKTFSMYENELDEIFEKNHKKDYIKGHDGINHCFVIRLLQQNVQMKMLKKLTDHYSNRNSTTQATLYANALLPEWVIRVYMEKFNFTRQEAINQIKAQDDYRLHMEEENDGSLIFD